MDQGCLVTTVHDSGGDVMICGNVALTHIRGFNTNQAVLNVTAWLRIITESPFINIVSPGGSPDPQ